MPHDSQRMPESVVAVAEQATQQKTAPTSSPSSNSQVQRYFRVPFKVIGQSLCDIHCDFSQLIHL